MTSPITGLCFMAQGKKQYLFMSTVDRIFSMDISVKDNESQVVLDECGCAPRCYTVTSESERGSGPSSGGGAMGAQFVVGRLDALHFYQPDSRGACFAFDKAEKIIVYWFRSYLAVVIRDSKTTSMSGSSSYDTQDKMILNIYDIHNKYVAYSAPLTGVVEVVSEWGDLFVFTREGKVYRLSEKDPDTKLEMLFNRSQYSLAIAIAKSHDYDEDGLVDIFQQYGDHLYSKGDHEGAIRQYIKTVGRLEASYVIRKYLDSQKIKYLIEYLQALHKHGLATEDHTTLLLNCYTNTNEHDKLKEFITTCDRDFLFDVDTAIRVCRQAEYYKEALDLAKQRQSHDWYLKIQLENMGGYEEAVDYIAKLDFDDAQTYIKKYGKMLVSNVPEKTTEIIKRLCTGFDKSGKIANSEDFIHIFVNNSAKLLEFIEHMIKAQNQSRSHILYNTLLELYLQQWAHAKVENEEKRRLESRVMDILSANKPLYDVDHALVLCRLSNFQPGILHLYEKTQSYQQIIAHHMDHNDYDRIIEVCERFGNADSSLWVHALWYFAQNNGCDRRYFTRVLQHIEEKRLLPPIMVVEIAAQSEHATLAVIKDYLIRYLESECEKIGENETRIRQYKEDTAKTRQHIEHLKHNPKIFQDSKCIGCKNELELPSIHFLCGHSYHQSCFETYSENASECPTCVRDNANILELIREQERGDSRDVHEHFHDQLAKAEDGVAVVAEFFSRGVFNRQQSLLLEQQREEFEKKRAQHQQQLPASIFERPSEFSGRVSSREPVVAPSKPLQPATKVPSVFEAPVIVAPAKNVFEKPQPFQARAPLTVPNTKGVRIDASTVPLPNVKRSARIEIEQPTQPLKRESPLASSFRGGTSPRPQSRYMGGELGVTPPTRQITAAPPTAAAGGNPFGEDDDANNPFKDEADDADLGVNNPFAETSNNPKTIRNPNPHNPFEESSNPFED